MERGIPHLVKFLRKLSEIKGDKNFLKRGEVDVIKFRPLIKILLKKILMNGTITGLSLSIFINLIILKMTYFPSENHQKQNQKTF